MAKLQITVREGNFQAIKNWLQDEALELGKVTVEGTKDGETILVTRNGAVVASADVSQVVNPIIDPDTGKELEFYREHIVTYGNIIPAMEDVVKTYSVNYNTIEQCKRLIAIVIQNEKDKLPKAEKVRVAKVRAAKVVDPNLAEKVAAEKLILRKLRKGLTTSEVVESKSAKKAKKEAQTEEF